MTVTPARRVAREVVTRVREGAAYGHETLSAALDRAHLAPEDAAFATRLAYGTLQTQGVLDEAIDRHTSGKRIEARVRDALEVAVYEVLFLHTENRAAVHQGVELVKTVRMQASGLANAVLRRIAEEAPAFPWGDPDTDDDALARLHAHPRWLADLWIRELGREAAARVMEADNTPAPLYLAANPFVATQPEAIEVLTADGAQPSACEPAGCIRVADAAAAVRGKALREGVAVVADAAAQLVASLTPVHPGDTIVEVGAGRGTKTMLLQNAAVAQGGPARLYAVDLHEFKSELLTRRLVSFGVPDVFALTGDATDLATVPGAPLPGTVDSVLVDAPCSGLGTLRRHPEKRWRVSLADIAELSALGLRLLSSAASLVRPGGFVVYSTCTLTGAENVCVVEEFLGSEAGRGFRIDPLEAELGGDWARCATAEGYFRSLPEKDGPDGHFAVRLARIEERG